MNDVDKKTAGSKADLRFLIAATAIALSAVMTAVYAPGALRPLALIPLWLLPPAYYFYCLSRLKELSSYGLEETADFVLGRGSPLIGAMQHRAEILPFLRECFPAPPSALAEIGRGKGGTLAMLCRAASPDALIISLDLPGSVYSGALPFLNKGAWRQRLLKALAGPGQDLRVINGDSKSPATLELFEKELGGRRLDLLFIDGDHAFEGVRSDFERYSRFVKPGGIIAFHDIQPGLENLGVAVSRFWRETSLPGTRKEFIENRSQISYGIGALQLPG
jgi:predicted O-methyltransferase YrrM